MLPRTVCRVLCCLLLALLASAPRVFAQPAPAGSEQPGLFASNTAAGARSLRCWWKPDRTSVRVGERFHLTLTCRVLETSAERAAPDERLLEPAAISLSPYEVIDGVRYQDVRQGPWRFFQYQYTLRIIGEDLFGTDVPIPALGLKYRAERSTGAGGQVGGQDRTYTLPAYPIRIASLVPTNAANIVDGSGEVFGDMRTRRFRADAAYVLAAILFVLPTAVAFSLLVRSSARARGKAPQEQTVGTAWLLRNLETELRQLKTSRETSGWSEALTGRALTAFRITGSLALDQPVVEHALATGATALVGQFALRKRQFRSRKVAVTSTLTPEGFVRHLAEADGTRAGHAAGREFLTNGFHSAFAAFNSARYAATTEQNDATLDEALTTASDGVRALRQEYTWARRLVRAFPQDWRHPWTRS